MPQSLLKWIRHASARSTSAPSSRHHVTTAAHHSCAGGEGEWEEIQIGAPAAVEGVAS